jgi:hypothetical protein
LSQRGKEHLKVRFFVMLEVVTEEDGPGADDMPPPSSMPDPSE